MSHSITKKTIADTEGKSIEYIEEYVKKNFPEGCKGVKCRTSFFKDNRCILCDKMYKSDLCNALEKNIPRSFKNWPFYYAGIVALIIWKEESILSILLLSAWAAFLVLILYATCKKSGKCWGRKGEYNVSGGSS